MTTSLRRVVRGLADRRYGIETDEHIDRATLGYEGSDRYQYEPSGWMAMPYALPRREVSSGDVFADLGSGKGRVVTQAARSYPFARVIGVEYSAELTEIARRNVDRIRGRMRSGDVELVNADVLEWSIPADLSIVWLHNPFQGELFAAMAERLAAFAGDAGRRLRIAYVNPIEHEVLVRAGAREAPPPSGLRARMLRGRAGPLRRYEMGPPGAPLTAPRG